MALLLLAAGAARASDEVVKAALEWEPGAVGYASYRNLPLAKELPDGVPMPRGLLEPRIASVALEGATLLSVLVDLGRTPSLLWTDSDQDADFTDESARAWVPAEGGGLVAFDTVVVRLPGEAERLPVDFRFSRTAERAPDAIGVRTGLHRRGLVEIGGRVRIVALVDGNADLRFDDPASDSLYVDVDADERFYSIEGSHERIPVGSPFELAGRGYVASVPERLGGVVEFRETKPPPPARWRFNSNVPPPKLDARPDEGDTLEALSARLGVDDPYARIGAVRRIARLGTKAAFDRLEKIAETDRHRAVRATAVLGMGHRQYRAEAARLVRLTKPTVETELRRQAVFALHNMDAPGRESAYAAILRSVGSASDKGLCGAAAVHLAYVGTTQSRALLVEAFRTQADPDLRIQIYEGGTHGDPEGPPRDLLEPALREEEGPFRGRAIRDLFQVRDRRARALALDCVREKEHNRRSAWYAVEVLGRIGDAEAVAAVLAVYDLTTTGVREHAGRYLRRVRDPGGIRSLIAGLKSPSAPVRSLAVDLLAAVRGSTATEALANALKTETDPDLAVRLADAVAEHGDPRVLPALLAVAKRADPLRRGAVLDALARLGAAHPDVVELFKDLLASPRWEDRMLGIDCAARSLDARTVPAVIACLDHAAWQVRLTAAEAFRRLRTKDAIEPLIVRLEKEEVARVREAIGDTLFRLTGQGFSDMADLWRRWWTDAREGFAVPAETPRPAAARNDRYASFYGLPIRSGSVCFVIDRSDSMEAVDSRATGKLTRLEAARAELLAALDRMKKGSRFNVILFGTDARPWKKSLIRLTPANRRAVEAHLRDTPPEGATNLYDALELALLDDDVDTVYLLSDGAPTAGKHDDPEEIRRAVRQLNRFRRIAIHTIALGCDSALLKDLAADHGGTYARR